MAKQTKGLTESAITRLTPKSKYYDTSDRAGLKLRVFPDGQRSWVYRYTKPNGKRTNWAFGQHPFVSLSEARLKVMEYKAMLAEGRDPQQARIEESVKREQTFESVAADWLVLKGKKVTPDYLDDVRRSLELWVYPGIGSLSIVDITAPVTIAALRRLEAQGKLHTLHRVCRRINEVMTFAVNGGICENNPLAGIAQMFPAAVSTENPSIEPSELPAFMKTLTGASITSSTRNCITLQLHCMLRPSEAAMLRWEEVDLEDRSLEISAERMKRRTAHRVPLTETVISILHEQQAIAGDSEWVFPAPRDMAKHLDPQSPNMALKRMGYAGVMTAHGMRSLATTACVDDGGFEYGIVDLALSHLSDAMTKEVTRSFSAYYRGTQFEKRRLLMEWWSGFINEALVSGITQKAVQGLRAV